MTAPGAAMDRQNLAQIQEAAPNLPLVLHGVSGIPPALRRRRARETSVCKFNIGTELRMVFGQSLRAALARDPIQFDRNQLLADTMPPMITSARAVIQNLS